MPKLPVEQVHVGRLGLDGDAHHHDHVHGGPHRAVCLLALEAIERVQADGHAIEPGAVGENLTTVGIEIARLPVGAQLAIGDELLLEIAAPANPCDVIKHVFVRGKSGRISILLHPDDSRMYARVLREGVVREGDPIRVLPPRRSRPRRSTGSSTSSTASSARRGSRRGSAAAAAGFDVRILDRGELAAAASSGAPGLRATTAPSGCARSRSCCRRSGPSTRMPGRPAGSSPGSTTRHGRVRCRRIRPASTPGRSRPSSAARAGPRRRPTSASRRSTRSDDAQIDRWIEASVAANEVPDEVAGAIRQTGPFLARTKGEHQVLASLDGRDVGVAALVHPATGRLARWRGGPAGGARARDPARADRWTASGARRTPDA